jgi:hypothetical protein
LRPIFDGEWRRCALAGCADAVQALAAAALQPLYSFCFYRVGRNAHLCEEVVQETLLHALRDLDHYDPGRAGNNIFPWLTGLARNEIHRTLARESCAVSLESLWARRDRELASVYGGGPMARTRPGWPGRQADGLALARRGRHPARQGVPDYAVRRTAPGSATWLNLARALG